ncbi:CoA-binding protein [Syntrophotalea acetylenivorans]|uniref:CoA-binding protein n=1 Tax=Syntrophotalea acetylenivorans TaxID=1842532 RepID=A0A1L3GQ25_9BACT|nr:CoA-binding protein [Syntrophotalea acetylenivorans]APG28024.1 CoA-binding protein [Syntrophotalea acetylenivorans]
MVNNQTMEEKIIQFLSADTFAVAGASTNRDKYGNKILRCYQQHGRRVIPVNPKADMIEGLPCAASVTELPSEVQSLSIITPPKITEQIVEQAILRGIKNIWMQPGAQSPAAISRCEEADINVIADGSCLLVVLGYHET